VRRDDEISDTLLGVGAMTGRQYPSGLPAGGNLVASERIQRRASATAPRAAPVLIPLGRALVRAGFRVLVEAGWSITAVEGLGEIVTIDSLSNVGGRRPPRLSRILANGDETRRRIERALHDGSQQRLVTLALELRAVKNAVPSERPDLVAQLAHLEEGLIAALEELREIARGVHPAVLSEGGLHPALSALARRSTVPVELELGSFHRLSEPVEVTVYYVVSEALANTAKHARASIIHVGVRVLDHALRLCVRDDGAGGADPTRGSGLFGLKDRVETLGGTMTVRSPRGGGTSLHVELPLEERPRRFARRGRFARRPHNESAVGCFGQFP
jgi:signal transduction histidine kinase